MKPFVFALTASMALAPIAASAVPIEHVREGQVYDFDVFGQFTNPRAEVLDVARGQVLIQILEGNRQGEVLWVAPGRLLTLDQSRQQEAENIGGGIVVGLALLCLISGECDEEAPAASTTTAPPPPSDRSSVSYTPVADGAIVVDNMCDREITFRFAYYNDGQMIRPDLDWTLGGDGLWRLNNEDGDVIMTDFDTILYHAETTDGAAIWSGDTNVRLGGQTFGMRRVDLSEEGQDYQLRLACDNI